MATKKTEKVTKAEKREVLAKIPFSKDGRKLGVRLEFSDGSDKTYLTSNGKAEKYVRELKEKQRFTNDGARKLDKDGNVQTLTEKQISYRSGYLAARQDSADIYNAKNNPGKLKLEKTKRFKRLGQKKDK